MYTTPMPLPPLPPVPPYQPESPITDYYDDHAEWRYPAVEARDIGDPALWQPHLAQKADPVIEAMHGYLTAYVAAALPNWRIYKWEPNTVGTLPRGGYFYPSPIHACSHCNIRLWLSDIDADYHKLHPLLLIPLMHRAEIHHAHWHVMTSAAELDLRSFTDLRHRVRTIQAIRRQIDAAVSLRAPFIRRLDAVAYDDPAPFVPNTAGRSARLDTSRQNRLRIEL